MNRIGRSEVKERVIKIRRGLGTDEEVALWIAQIRESVPNRQVMGAIMAGKDVDAEEIVDRLYKADAICL